MTGFFIDEENIPNEPLEIIIPTFVDDRGILTPLTDFIDEKLIKRSYVVANHTRGTIRGLHYHQKEMKVFYLARGSAKFLTVQMTPEEAEKLHEQDKLTPKDAEEYNKTIKWNIFTLTDKHPALLVVPPFFANGWISLSDDTVLVSLSNLTHEDAQDDDIRINPLFFDLWATIPR